MDFYIFGFCKINWEEKNHKNRKLTEFNSYLLHNNGEGEIARGTTSLFPWSCIDVRVGLWRRLSTEELMLLNCGVGEDSWESLGLQGDPTSPFWSRLALGFLWKEWCWSWNSRTLATSYEELTHWKRLWCWEGLRAGGEGDDRGWDGWMASLTRWMWVWVNSGSWWWTREAWLAAIHGVAKSRTRLSDWTELDWTEPHLFLGMATHSSNLSWGTPWTVEPGMV